MKKRNQCLATTLAIFSMTACLAIYLDRWVIVMCILSFIVSMSIAFYAMMQTLHYKKGHEYNPIRFWSIWSAVCGVILVMILILYVVKIIPEKLAIAFIGLVFTIFPVFGVFKGQYLRSLNDESMN